jgi:hypothetical protein
VRLGHALELKNFQPRPLWLSRTRGAGRAARVVGGTIRGAGGLAEGAWEVNVCSVLATLILGADVCAFLDVLE